MDIPPSKDDLKLFNSFNLYPKTYKEMINVIIKEIKDRNRFKI